MSTQTGVSAAIVGVSLLVLPFQGREGSNHFRPIAHEIDKNEVENPLNAFCVVVSASLPTRPPTPPTSSSFSILIDAF